MAWNVEKTLFDSRPMVAWPPTNVAWPFSDFFSKKFLIGWNVWKRRLTVGRRLRDLRPRSPDRSATFFKIFPNCLKQPCVTVDRRSRDLRPLSQDRSATSVPYFAIFVETSTKFVWKPVKSRLTSRLICFRGFSERLTHMLASKCLSRWALIFLPIIKKVYVNNSCNVTDSNSWYSHEIELTLFLWHMNWHYFRGICQMMPLNAWPNTAWSCNHQSTFNLHASVTAFMFSCSGTQCTTHKGWRLGWAQCSWSSLIEYWQWHPFRTWTREDLWVQSPK